MHPNLKEILQNYDFSLNQIFIFPNRDGSNHISLRVADKIFRSAVNKAGLETKGISTHSTRRSFITKLHSKGCDLYTIKAITGHQDLKALSRYVEIQPDRIKNAIEQLI